MRCVLMTLLVFTAAKTSAADDPAKATWTVDGKTYKFAKEGMKEGEKVVLAFLESCLAGDESGRDGKAYTEKDFKKAAAGDHFHIVFCNPQKVTVMSKPVEVTELVFSAGSLWVRSGDKIQRFAKYDPKKTDAFLAWRQDAAKSKSP